MESAKSSAWCKVSLTSIAKTIIIHPAPTRLHSNLGLGHQKPSVCATRVNISMGMKFISS